ncbi:hydantoinase/oxoprolinase family protein [Amycolatopsis sp. GM8]|uniref:hydantoinase/oxoprolinase family protein n=1 Tax=Amycolatopsis sp. GM8 TaxID=2896530 RepID=UPI001F2370FD|nr:hydantoinase/oxoprolinase family protein [Amycolatopsis sp. GM8]
MDPASEQLYVGVDTGGTFTDLVVMDAAGRIHTNKAPTTPHALEEGVFTALELVAADRGETVEEMLGKVESFGHGTTQATNALIERNGTATGLITTQGFGDTLIIQRLMGFTAGMPTETLSQFKSRSYPLPITPRQLIAEVPERVDQAGNVLVPLDEPAVRAAVEQLGHNGAKSFAVCFLWSFRHPEHERRVREIIRDIAGDGAYISLSSEVSPVLGEYERTATTVLNSYLGPTVAKYLERLESSLQARGLRGRFSVLNSIGGVMSARDAASRAVLLLASGPTGGVIGSRYLASELGHANVITTDMGGTSFDVGLIVDGRPVISGVTEVGKYHVSAPMVDITAIGAGGGSIAQVAGGKLLVGPESAGAFPGPVAYRRGGTRVTVTDADLVLGIIDPTTFLGGRMSLDPEAAEAAIREQIAEPLGLSTFEAAAGIRRIVDAKMADTLRELTVGRGMDPRDFVLYAYGGAGPMHCAGFGAELGVRQILVPATSMAHSAYGALASDIHHSAEISQLVRTTPGNAEPWLDLDSAHIAAVFAELERGCRSKLSENGVPDDQMVIQRSADVRYRSQTHELIIPIGDGPFDDAATQTLIGDFEETYEQTYGRGAAFREAGIELTTFRVEAVGHTPSPAFAVHAPEYHAEVERATRPVYDVVSGGWLKATIVPWPALRTGDRIPGPAVVEHPTTTVYVDANQWVSIDAVGNLLITLAM